MPSHVNIVSAGKIFDHLDIRRQSRAGIYPFKQIMAQHGIFGDTPRQSRLKRIDLINALAGE